VLLDSAALVKNFVIHEKKLFLKFIKKYHIYKTKEEKNVLAIKSRTTDRTLSDTSPTYV
jgi:putative IMPACT (imprinted ancient) family translation regulator